MSGENITIQVNLHAILRNLAQAEGSGPIQLTMASTSCVADILPLLKLSAMEVVYSLNSTIVDQNALLKDGDRIDIIPAISGG